MIKSRIRSIERFSFQHAVTQMCISMHRRLARATNQSMYLIWYRSNGSSSSSNSSDVGREKNKITKKFILACYEQQYTIYVLGTCSNNSHFNREWPSKPEFIINYARTHRHACVHEQTTPNPNELDAHIWSNETVRLSISMLLTHRPNLRSSAHEIARAQTHKTTQLQIHIDDYYYYTARELINSDFFLSHTHILFEHFFRCCLPLNSRLYFIALIWLKTHKTRVEFPKQSNDAVHIIRSQLLVYVDDTITS